MQNELVARFDGCKISFAKNKYSIGIFIRQESMREITNKNDRNLGNSVV